MNGRQVHNITERRPDIILPWGLQGRMRMRKREK